jgi:hypothetical protein
MSADILSGDAVAVMICDFNHKIKCVKKMSRS